MENDPLELKHQNITDDQRYIHDSSDEERRILYLQIVLIFLVNLFFLLLRFILLMLRYVVYTCNVYKYRNKKGFSARLGPGSVDFFFFFWQKTG